LEKSEDPSERERSNALFAEVVKRRAGFLSFQLEGEEPQKEIDEFAEAVLFASQHGDLFVSSYLDSIRQACEETDIDAEALIQKVPPLTFFDFFTKDGRHRYLKKLSETLSDEEFLVSARANEIALSRWSEIFKRRSSNA